LGSLNALKQAVVLGEAGMKTTDWEVDDESDI
jgi:hypothetical protein